MFGLLRRPERKTRALPRLECLEGRDLPSTLSLSLVSYNAGKSVTLTGTLSNTPNPAYQQVYLTGKVIDTIKTDANGNFTVTEVADGLGTVYAQTADSNQATVTLTDATLTLLSFTATEGSGDLWEFKGSLSYGGRPTAGLTVYFGGAPVSLSGKTGTVDASGNFDVFIQLSGTSSDNGTALAGALTAWGDPCSSPLYADVYQT